MACCKGNFRSVKILIASNATKDLEYFEIRSAETLDFES